MKARALSGARKLGVLTGMVLILSSCSADPTRNEQNTLSDTATATPALTLATLLPETTPLSFLVPPIQAGTALALADINAAGGVLGSPVEIISAVDEGDGDDLAKLERSVAEVIESDASFVLGGLSSNATRQLLSDAMGGSQLVGSPISTSAQFSGADAYYFRTGATDRTHADALAKQILADNKRSVAFLTFDTEYGASMRDTMQTTFENNAASVVYGARGEGNEFPIDQTFFDAELTAVKASGAEAIVITVFDQIAALLPALNAHEIDLSTVYLVTDATSVKQAHLAPGTLLGAQTVLPGESRDTLFNAKLVETYESAFGAPLNTTRYAAETYDLVTLVALAATQAGTIETERIRAELASVSGADGGTTCQSYAECAELIASGSKISYTGKAGIGPLNTENDSSFATLGSYKYDEQNTPILQGSVVGDAQ